MPQQRWIYNHIDVRLEQKPMKIETFKPLKNIKFILLQTYWYSKRSENMHACQKTLLLIHFKPHSECGRHVQYKQLPQVSGSEPITSADSKHHLRFPSRKSPDPIPPAFNTKTQAKMPSSCKELRKSPWLIIYSFAETNIPQARPSRSASKNPTA
jgi:hypothetical protein